VISTNSASILARIRSIKRIRTEVDIYRTAVGAALTVGDA
jgi:hypothetical protein